MKLPRRNFLHLAAGAAALPAVTRTAWAQAYPARNSIRSQQKNLAHFRTQRPSANRVFYVCSQKIGQRLRLSGFSPTVGR
jgi:hypothetical protein